MTNDVEPKGCPEVVHKEARPAFDFKRLSEFGVLWLINRVVFHPRGFALALEYSDEDGNTDPVGWSIQGDGSETWRFEGFNEDEKFEAIEGLLQQARRFGMAPHYGPTEEIVTCSCGDLRWVEDKNWSPEYPKQTRERRNGMIPCGFCNPDGED